MTSINSQRSWISQFSVIMTGQVFSLLGSGIVQFSIIWHLNQTSNSAVVLSVAMIMGILPVILLSPFAGVVADRFDRKKVMIIADALIAAVTLLFVILLQIGTLPVETFFILLFCRAAGTAFHQPAFESAMPMITPKHHLTRVAAIIQMLRSGINLAAPLLGVLLLGFLKLQLILLIDIVTAAIAIFSLLIIELPKLIHKSAHPSTLSGYMKDLKIGFRYVYHWKGLLALILAFSIANFLLAPVLAMMPLVITGYFKGGVAEYGFFEMSLAIGIILGSLTLSVWGCTKKKIISVNIAQILCGVFITVIGFVSPGQFYLVLGAAVLIGISSAYINSPVIAIIQGSVDKHALGRVMSIATTLTAVSMPISLVFAGPLAEHFSPMLLIWLPGLLSVLLGVVCFLIPDLMKIEDEGHAVHQKLKLLDDITE